MTRVLYPFLALTLLVACSNSNTVHFGMYSKYDLRTGEVNHFPIPQEKIDEYEACCYLENQMIFLNRAITHTANGFRVFIGAGETTSRGDFNRALAVDSSSVIFEQKRFVVQKTSYEAHFTRRANHYLCRVNFDEAKSGLFLVVDHVFSDSTRCAAYYANIEQELARYIR
jgi:hypothetical protein